LPVFVEQRGGLLKALDDLFLGRRNGVKGVFDKLETRYRAGGDRLVGVDDEGIGGAVTA